MFDKSEQLKWDKSITKKVHKRIATDDEVEYLNWMKSRNERCFVCGSSNTELHHIKHKSTDQKNHYEVLPLCHEHHHGNVLSPHGTPKLWREEYEIPLQKAYAYSFYLIYKREKELP